MADAARSLRRDGLTRFGMLRLDDPGSLSEYGDALVQASKLRGKARHNWIKKQNDFDADYYERGVQTKKSGYENYRWMPELTMRMAHHMMADLGIARNDKVLDFGCAKGFLVKAFRLFGIDAYGVDVSAYAIQSVEPDTWGTRESCKIMVDWKMPFRVKFDWMLAKDVVEHLDEEELARFLELGRRHAKRLFVAVPLGRKQNGGYRFVIDEYENDATHVIRRPPSWWKTTFARHGWRVSRFHYTMTAVKENWTSAHPRGNGFFVLER